MKLAIRPYELTDAEALHAAAMESVDTVGRWLPWCHAELKLDELRAWIEKEIALRAEGLSFEFIIEDEEGNFLGGCCVNRVDPELRIGNLGYWVRSSMAGRGIVSRAARMAVEWAFAETELERIEVLCEVENTGSQRVAEKIGALREGLLRSRLFVHGKPRDVFVYSVIRSDVE